MEIMIAERGNSLEIKALHVDQSFKQARARQLNMRCCNAAGYESAALAHCAQRGAYFIYDSERHAAGTGLESETFAQQA